MTDNRPRLIRTAEAARAIGVDPATLRRWARSGIVTPASRTAGGQDRWNLADLQRQLDDRNRQEGSPVTDPTKPEQQPVVMAVVTSDRGLLVTWRNDAEPPAGFLSGEIEPGESPVDAMVRECKEEAGLLVLPGEEIGRRVHPRSKRTTIYVAGRPAPGKADVFVGDRDELADVRWVSLEEADEAMAAYGGMYPPVHDWVRRALGKS
jgi:8-oxo-dGTP pyrophosphatase MutT (NUDIX family)